MCLCKLNTWHLFCSCVLEALNCFSSTHSTEDSWIQSKDAIPVSPFMYLPSNCLTSAYKVTKILVLLNVYVISLKQEHCSLLLIYSPKEDDGVDL